MKLIKHLSPTSIALYKESPEDYYLRYLAENAPPRDPQTEAMAVGSSFDAYVKSYLHQVLYGKGFDAKFEFNTLFEAQVEPHNREVAKEAGGWCFEWYRRLGTLADLLVDLSKSIDKPCFEVDLRGAIVVEGQATRSGVVSEIEIGDVSVVFNGKPDCYFTTAEGVLVVLDWKVNGFYSNSPPSPKPGYLRLRADGKMPAQHERVELTSYKGVNVNTAMFLDDIDDTWARQLSVYARQAGNPIGNRFVARIEQLVCNVNHGRPGKPAIRTAAHSLFVREEYQRNMFAEAAKMWKLLHSEPFHFFADQSIDDSRNRCQLLDKRAAVLYGPGGDAKDDWFKKTMKRSPW